MGLGWSEILLLGVVALLVFGRDLPKVARDCGRWVSELRRALTQIF